jgi:hypothetical protein
VAVALAAFGLGERRVRVLALAAALFVAGLWWGSVRLDALDHSELRLEIGRAGPALLEVTGPSRRSPFEVRVPVRVLRFDGESPGERAWLDLPAGRAPPQGALLSAIVEVGEPRPEEDGFDEAGYLRRQGVHVILTASTFRVVGRRGGLGGIADRVRGAIARSLAPGVSGERRAVIAAVVLGEDEGLSPGLRDQFRASGLYHLLRESRQTITAVVPSEHHFESPARASHVEGDVDPNARRPSSEGLRGQGVYPGRQAGARLENGRSPEWRPRSGGGTVKRDGGRRAQELPKNGLAFQSTSKAVRFLGRAQVPRASPLAGGGGIYGEIGAVCRRAASLL